MNGSQLENERLQRRAFMLNEGILNNSFKMLERLEEWEEDYIEDIMRKYIDSMPEYIQKLEKILMTQPLDINELERLMMKMKGASASVGAQILVKAIDEMLETFHDNNRDTYRLGSALGKVRSELDVFKSYFEPYLQILAQQRGEAPPVEDSDMDED